MPPDSARPRRIAAPRSAACWTCKIRRVKCDEAFPKCSECTDRLITCHGYGNRPSWMDGGRAEREERNRIKASLKRHLHERLSNRRRQQVLLQANQDDAGSLTLPNPGNVVIDAPDRLHQTRSSSIPSHSIFAQTLRYDESRLLMHYLDCVFPLQYPYYPLGKRGGRGWLLWLLSKNGSLMRASLGLAALHLRHTDQAPLESSSMELEYLTRVLRELREAITTWITAGTDLPEEGLVEVVAAGAALITFEVLRGSTDGWQPHLNVVTSVLTASAMVRSLTGATPALSWAADTEPLHAALSFHVPVVLWIDILSCVSTRSRPKLPYTAWLETPTFDLQLVMGCHSWVMKLIGDLADLNAQSTSEVSKTPSQRADFNQKIMQIEYALQAGIASMHGARQDATAVFAEAALVQAAIMRMTSVRSLRRSTVEQAVDRVLDEINLAHDVVTARQIPWPACVAGCMASGDQRRSFEAMLLKSAEGRMGQVGNCGTVLKVMRRCWQLQDSQQGKIWDCSGTMQEMGISVLLI